MSDSPGLGTLDWQPAAAHPHLLAVPVQEALTLVPGTYVAAIDPGLADTAAFCDAYGVGLDASANCVVVAGRRGETRTLAACLVLATDRADVNKVVRRHLDVAKISFAPMDQATAETGMEYGGITPVGLPVGWPILVDARVVAAGWVVIGSGLRGSKLAIRGTDLLTLAGAVKLELAQPRN
ncbi:MAG: YbaK/EbsC family protein [Propionibacteriaceae bacterium]